MKYTMDARVRYSEVGMDDRMTLDAVLRYFQDCAVFHSEDVGFGMDRLKENHLVWFLSSWQICIGEYPKVAEQLKVSTWPYAFQRMMGERNHTITTPEGRLLAWANSSWVLMDTQKQRPTLVPDSLAEKYDLEEPLSMEYAPRKIAVPGDGHKEEPIEITRAYLDSNHHVNNAKYVQIAEAYLPDDFEIQQLRVEYKHQALLGDRMYPVTAVTEEERVISLNNESGQPYAVVAFKGK